MRKLGSLTLIAVALAASACSTPRVRLVEGPREYVAADYEAVLRTWTRNAQFTNVNAMDNVLTVTATAKLADKTVFLVEAQQAGIFQIRNLPQESLEPVLSVTCPNILFPYARETVSDAIVRAVRTATAVPGWSAVRDL